MKDFNVWLAVAFIAVTVLADNECPKGDVMFKIQNFSKIALETCETDGCARFKTNGMVDCSPLLAKNSNLTPAKIAVIEGKLQVDCPANGYYKLTLRVAAPFQPGQNYLWSFTCWQRALVETQRHEMTVSYKMDDMADGQGVVKGFAVTKNIALSGGGYQTYTFIISIPPGGAVGARPLDLEISNENLKDTGGILKFIRMEVKAEVNEHAIYELWPDSLPPGQMEVLPNQAYIDGNGRFFRDISRPTLIVYKPM